MAHEQWAISRTYDERLIAELEGIAAAADISIVDLVVLNNYTDFRDLAVPDQGCSVVFVQKDERRFGGQTWDMHGSAKNYVCVLDIPASDDGPRQVAFSVVGCVGMMGFNSHRAMVGVNNINTNGARPGVLWPMLIRRLLQQSQLGKMSGLLEQTPVTSGHTYLLAAGDGAAFWEVMPDLAEKVSELSLTDSGNLFHTNHCLGPAAQNREIKNSLSSTTHKRFELIAQKVGRVETVHSLFDLLNDHENYPMSICSHYQTNSTDPSFTCGGAAGDLNSGKLFFWRGDPMLDANYRMHQLQI